MEEVDDEGNTFNLVKSGLIGGNNPFEDPSFDNIPTIRPSYKSLGPKLVGPNGLVTEIFNHHCFW